MKVQIIKRSITDFNDAADSERILEVQDEKGRVFGFLATKATPYVSATSGKTKRPVRWGFALVEGEFRSGIQFAYSNRSQALEALAQMRTLKPNTSSIKVAK